MACAAYRAKLQQGGTLSWQDLGVGKALQLYGRTYHITGCDGATRRWLEEQGASQPPDGELPEGPIDLAAKVRGKGDRAADRVC